VVGKVGINEYKGTRTFQFIIDDYEIVSMSWQKLKLMI
jgi:hypothetical protein